MEVKGCPVHEQLTVKNVDDDMHDVDDDADGDNERGIEHIKVAPKFNTNVKNKINDALRTD